MTATPSEHRYCERCGKPASSGAHFCAGCGHALGGGNKASPPSNDHPKVLDHLGGEPEPHEGDARARDSAPLDFRPLAVQTVLQLFACILTLGLGWVVLWIRRSHTRYVITPDRLEIRTGVVNVVRRSVELFRVQDMEIREPFFLRMRSAGHIYLKSLDPTEPEVVVQAVAQVHDVHETLRKWVSDERRRLGVRLIEERS